MFPTFNIYTQRYPRLLYIVGLLVFGLGVALWVHVILPVEENLVLVPIQKIPHGEMNTGLSDAEKRQILENLTNTEASISAEERERILTALVQSEDSMSDQEKIQILETLQ